ncbi:DUF1007 family protein [Rhodovibrionaceae bacterium A322]
MTLFKPFQALSNCRILAVLLVSVFATLAQPVKAHPHAWIDLRSTVILNDAGEVVGIEQQWLFDQFYTLFVTEGVDSDPVRQKEVLTDLAKTNLQNLSAYDYFTDAWADKTPVTFQTVTDYESELRNGRLWMRFIVPFETAVDPKDVPFSFSVYDPTYYIEILHLKEDIVDFRGPVPHRCTALILPPSPDTETVMLAQAMDRDAQADDTLGAVFAEKVEVLCQ